MNKGIKMLIQASIITSLLSLLFSFPVQALAVQPVPTAGVYINGKVVNGIKPVRVGRTYYLPITHLSKILRYNSIGYEKGTGTYEVTDGSTIIRMTVGGSLAKKSDEYLNINPPRWINGAAYISIGSAGNLFNVDITFQPRNGSIQVVRPAKYYVVQHNDSLWKIAHSLHTDVARLKARNKLSSNIIYVGQRLYIPSADMAKEMEPVKEKQPIAGNKPSSNLPALRQKVINAAEKYIGAKYKYGAAMAEAPSYFDCSSYTKTVFANVGITIPRVSRDQASKGVYVKSSYLMPGDLMFFTNKDAYSDGRVGHVGIYIGNGDMIHASTSQGVIITDHALSNPYWSKNYLFSKRIIK